MSEWEFVGDCTFICKKCGKVMSQDELIEISGSMDEYWDAKCPKCEKEGDEK